MAFLGFCLTFTYVLGLAAVIIKRFFFEWGFNGPVRGTSSAIWLGALVTLGVMLLVGRVSRVRQKPIDVTGPGEIAGWDQRNVYQTIVSPEHLTDPGFWAKARFAKRFLEAHALVAILGLSMVTAIMLRQAARGEQLSLRGWLSWLGLLQAAGLVVLLGSSIAAYRRVAKYPIQERLGAWRPFILATLAVAFAGGLLSLATFAAQKALGPPVTSAEVDLGTPFKSSFAALLVALLF